MESQENVNNESSAARTDTDMRIHERFHLYPKDRLQAVAIVGGIIGAFSGFYDGVSMASLRYLTENGHRLPRKVGGWYFYHKKKNYVMIMNGCKEGLKQGTKLSLTVTGFFGLEAFFDTYVRHNTIDLLNTTAAAMITCGVYGVYHRLSKVQTIKYVKRGALLGLSLGFSQDMLIWIRGGRIWYLESLGIVNPRIQAKEDTLFEA